MLITYMYMLTDMYYGYYILDLSPFLRVFDWLSQTHAMPN